MRGGWGGWGKQDGSREAGGIGQEMRDGFGWDRASNNVGEDGWD